MNPKIALIFLHVLYVSTDTLKAPCTVITAFPSPSMRFGLMRQLLLLWFANKISVPFPKVWDLI